MRLSTQKSEQTQKKYSQNVIVIKQILTSATYLAAIWIIFEGLAKILSGQKADGITAIASVIEALKLGSIVGYVWGIGATIAWQTERSGKKRAIQRKSDFQKLAEKDNPNRTSSGLNSDGSTPKGD